jgi:hypothetical protein
MAIGSLPDLTFVANVPSQRRAKGNHATTDRTEVRHQTFATNLDQKKG